MLALIRALALAAALLCAGAIPAGAETRIALVIGNSAYRHAPRLINPANDAPTVGDALKRAGFSVVTVRLDLDQAGMRQALQTFATAARSADMAVIYYAGHGMEMGGTNFLIPIDAQLASDTDVGFEAVPMDFALRAVGGARRLGLVMLDACRNNPFANAMQMTGGSTRSVTRGLAKVEPLGNTLVAYAARDGTTAEDGAGRNSPFALALARRLPEPGLELSLLFRKVRDDVLQSTSNRQQPFTYGSLSGDSLYFVPPAAGASPVQTASIDPRALDLAMWQAVGSSNDIGQLTAYLTRYPRGEFADVARAKIEALKRPPPSPPIQTIPSPGSDVLAEATPITRAAGVRCNLVAARLVGRTKSPDTTYYEVACDKGFGFIIQAQAGASRPAAFTCLEAGSPGADGKPSNLACKLPRNAYPVTDLASFLTTAKVDCRPETGRGIGQTATATYIEVQCQGGAQGYVLKTSAPADPDQPVEASDCFLYDDADTNIKCTLRDKTTRLSSIDRLAKDANQGCTVTNRRYVGQSKTGDSFFEVACADRRGFIYKTTGGRFAQAYPCELSEAIMGGCTLTNSAAASAGLSADYSRRARAANFDCSVSKYAAFPSQPGQDVIELACSNRTDGAVAILKGAGETQVIPCALAPIAGYRCSFSAQESGFARLTADLRRVGKTTCEVSGSRVVGKTAKGTTYMEVACHGGAKGFLVEYLQSALTPIAAIPCPGTGNCKLPGNEG